MDFRSRLGFSPAAYKFCDVGLLGFVPTCEWRCEQLLSLLGDLKDDIKEGA